MKSLIRALNGILETFVCTWGSMYAEIKQQPLLACFLCSYNLCSRLCFSYCKSLSYIYVFIYLYSEASHVYMQFWGLIMAMFSPAMPHQSVEGVWSCCLPCFCPILATAAVAWGISGGLLTYEFCGPFWVWSRATMGGPGEVLSCLLLVSSSSVPEEPIHTTWWLSCWLGPCSFSLSKPVLPIS